MTNFVLAGFKGVGKTTVGKGLAEKLELDFIDLDDEIERLFEAENGERLGFRAIFKRVGAEAFRALETRAARTLRDRAPHSVRGFILSIGGGALTVPETAAELKQIGPVICLSAPFEEILQRIQADGAPAYVDPAEMESQLRAMFQERQPLLTEQADVIVDIAGLEPDEAIDKVWAEIAEL